MDEFINKYAEVRVEKQLNMLSVKFLGFVPFEEFVKIVEHEYQFIRNYKLDKCIIDLRPITVYDKGMPEYVTDTWFPTVTSLGMKRAAFIVPEQVLGQMSMDKAHKDAESKVGMAVKHFKDIETAMEWLKTR